jgi:ribonuclease P protein component
VRLLKTAEYRKIYQEGSKYAGPLFAAFYRRTDAPRPARVGYTTPKTIGSSVVRNRIRRRLREAVRLQLPSLEPGWEIVFNPRRAVLDADFSRLTSEVERLFGLLRAKRV